MMGLLPSAILFLLAGAALSVVLGTRGRKSGPFTAALGSALGAASGVQVIADGVPRFYQLPWDLPLGAVSLEIDPLSGWFMAIIGTVCAVAALYGQGYMKGGHTGPSAHWPVFHLLVTAMMVVASARNGVLFLLAWEAMSLTSFLLVMTEHGKGQVRRAGWVYLVASHLGSVFLLVFFCLLDRDGTFSLTVVADVLPPHPALFLLALAGFGLKAGLMPLHVWLPEAHPAAPSHVSAVMSGVMVKMGLYGLIRSLFLLGPFQEWWGWALLGVGAVSAVLGVLNTLAQTDLKRVLAWSTVENMGVMTLALGLGVLGVCRESSTLAVVSIAACLLHAANHSVFKALLFLGAGSVMHGTGTLQIDRMGGLLRRMHVTGVTMLIGFTAMAALPPLSGFAGEFLIIGAALSDSASRGAILPGVPVVAVMALVGALSLACAVRVFGIAFLGEPRTSEAAGAQESNTVMTGTLMVLAAGCVVMGLLAPVMLSFAVRSTEVLNGASGRAPVALQTPLAMATAVAAGWVLVALFLAGFRALLLRRRSVRRGITWDCGYAAPSPRMQYTASSFSLPVITGFAWLLGMSRVSALPAGLFPVRASLESRADDVVLRRGYEPVFRVVEWLAHRCRPLQQGRNQVYVLYIALTVLFLLVWKLRLT